MFDRVAIDLDTHGGRKTSATSTRKQEESGQRDGHPQSSPSISVSNCRPFTLLKDQLFVNVDYRILRFS